MPNWTRRDFLTVARQVEAATEDDARAVGARVSHRWDGYGIGRLSVVHSGNSVEVTYCHSGNERVSGRGWQDKAVASGCASVRRELQKLAPTPTRRPAKRVAPPPPEFADTLRPDVSIDGEPDPLAMAAVRARWMRQVHHLAMQDVDPLATPAPVDELLAYAHDGGGFGYPDVVALLRELQATRAAVSGRLAAVAQVMGMSPAIDRALRRELGLPAGAGAQPAVERWHPWPPPPARAGRTLLVVDLDDGPTPEAYRHEAGAWAEAVVHGETLDDYAASEGVDPGRLRWRIIADPAEPARHAGRPATGSSRP